MFTPLENVEEDHEIHDETHIETPSAAPAIKKQFTFKSEFDRAEYYKAQYTELLKKHYNGEKFLEKGVDVVKRNVNEMSKLEKELNESLARESCLKKRIEELEGSSFS